MGSGNAQGWVYAVGNAEKNGNVTRGPTSNVFTHPFNIDLMPVELDSFDIIYVIIGMDWLRRCHAVIVCDEKLVRFPYGNETLIFCGNESNDGRESRVSRGLAGSSSGSTSRILDQLNSRSRAHSLSTVSIGTVRNEGIVGTTARAFRQRLHKTQFLTLGSPGLVTDIQEKDKNRRQNDKAEHGNGKSTQDPGV
ncbi:putative reverse transcriptase domain-containing protein [Tanacetum coccineum]